LKKVKVLFRSSRFLMPATMLLNENGLIEVVLDTQVSESRRTKGSLSPREVSSVISRYVKLILEGRECGFTVRKSKRKIEVLDRSEGRLLKYLGVSPSEVIKIGGVFYCEIYVIKIKIGGLVHTLIANRRSAAILENYLSKYCRGSAPI